MLDTTRKTKNNVFNDIDEELRILYVAVTRAKENLFLIDSQNGEGYDEILNVIKEEKKLIKQEYEILDNPDYFMSNELSK